MSDRSRPETTAAGPGRAPTILDLARASGVSKSTVSRVLNGASNVAPESRARVHSAMVRLGFRINHAARSMRTRRTAMVGLVVPAFNEVFGRAAEIIDRGLRERGIGLMISCSGWNAAESVASIEALHSRGVDGMIISLGNDTDESVQRYLQALELPFVLMDREVPGCESDAVLTDQRPGISDAVEHLASVGRTSIGMVAMSPSTRPGRQSVAAFRDAAARLDLDVPEQMVVASDRFDRAAGEEAADRLLDLGANAIIAAVPMAALAGILGRLLERGVAIPDDVSLVGYHEHELASVKPPRLTVVDRPIDRIGSLAVQLLVDRLANPAAPPRREIVRTRLILGESSAPPLRRTQPLVG